MSLSLLFPNEFILNHKSIHILMINKHLDGITKLLNEMTPIAQVFKNGKMPNVINFIVFLNKINGFLIIISK